MERLRVLYVAFYFPPTSGGGVERTLRFLRYLPEHGVDAEVLTPIDAKWLAEDPASLARVPADVRVHRIPYRGPDLRVLPAERIRRAGPGLPGAVERARLAPQRLLLPDANATWLADVVPAALRLLSSGRFDALVTTAPPHTVTVAGAMIRARSGVPWIADWRDPWLTHADLDRSRGIVRAKAAATGPLARWAARRMDAAACVEYAVDELDALAPRVPREVIVNGVDVAEVERLVPRPDPDRLVLTFAGYFFGDRRPTAFLDALEGLLSERPGLAGRVVARFLGGFPDADRVRVEGGPLADAVALEGTRPHGEALQAQADAGCLLLFMQDGGGEGAKFVPAKVREYLAAGRPVLALVPPEGAAADLLRRHATAWIVGPEDVEGCRRALREIVERWEAGTLAGRPLDPALRAEIDRRTGAARLAGLIRRTVAARA